MQPRHQGAFTVNRVIVLCVLSALLGGLAAVAWHHPSLTDTRSVAQEQTLGPEAAFGVQPSAGAPPATPAATAALDALTPARHNRLRMRDAECGIACRKLGCF